MDGKIYLIHADDQLETLRESPYRNERLLQKFLAQHPDLLAGDQINPSNPRRWLLISREVDVPSDESSAGWLDHLFLDQDGVPTLVEVKRSTDTRIRREVVGQMLDYAANATVHWSIEYLQSKFREHCQDDPIQVVAEFLDLEPDDETRIEGFWQQVKTNLEAGLTFIEASANSAGTDARLAPLRPA